MQRVQPTKDLVLGAMAPFSISDVHSERPSIVRWVLLYPPDNVVHFHALLPYVFIISCSIFNSD